jgi:hypothetical protein
MKTASSHQRKQEKPDRVGQARRANAALSVRREGLAGWSAIITTLIAASIQGKAKHKNK